MLILKAYKIELDPNNVQRTLLAKHAGAARYTWNWALNRRGVDFRCHQCGARGHADVLAARNLVRRATGRFQRVEAKKAGIQTRSEGRDKTA